MRESVKALLLCQGCVQLTGENADAFIAKSTAGPGAGASGSVFFSCNGKRVRMSLAEDADVVITHFGNGRAVLKSGDIILEGELERPGQHCPNQAFLTLSASCIFNCRYCAVPKLKGRRKTIAEIRNLIDAAGKIEAISLTSGVANAPEEEEAYTLAVIRELQEYHLPIGAEVYPIPGTARRLHDAGVSEVKFNLETATAELFAKNCPGLKRDIIEAELDEAVRLFGKNRVFTNIIAGLGETDTELCKTIEDLASRGIIVSLRPLHPVHGTEFTRPDAERLTRLVREHSRICKAYDLKPALAKTMCAACTGCDLVPGRD